jgi:hypothetical protein
MFKILSKFSVTWQLFYDNQDTGTNKYAQQGDGWLNKEMVGYIGSAPACYDSSLGSNPDISKNTK